jgi:hypothetical protein
MIAIGTTLPMPMAAVGTAYADGLGRRHKFFIFLGFYIYIHL